MTDWDDRDAKANDDHAAMMDAHLDPNFFGPRPNVRHVDDCQCYLQGDRPVVVAPCFAPTSRDGA